MALHEKLGTVGGLFRYPVKSLCGEGLEAADLTAAAGVSGDRQWAFWDVARKEISNAKRSPPLLQIAAQSLENGHALLRLPDGSSVHTGAPDCAHTVSGFLGREVKLYGLRPASEKAHFARERIAPEKREAQMREVLGLLADEPLPDFSKLPREALLHTTVPGTYFDAAPLHVILASELRRLQESLSDTVVNALRFRPNIVIDDRAAPHSSESLIGATLQMGTARIKLDYLTPRCSMTTHAQEGLAKAPQIMRRLVQDWKHDFGLYGGVIQEGCIRRGDPVSRVAAA